MAKLSFVDAQYTWLIMATPAVLQPWTTRFRLARIGFSMMPFAMALLEYLINMARISVLSGQIIPYYRDKVVRLPKIALAMMSRCTSLAPP